ncbi:MAG: type III pantothenate kinase [Bacteroidia bacterium]|jgi:type III pantothenate kinase|nr:type III pantothenate kinase [Bacteroidia bacterium]
MDITTTYIAVDGGNTRLKWGIFGGTQLLHAGACQPDDLVLLQNDLKQHKPSHAIIANVGKPLPEVNALLAQNASLHVFGHGSPLPFYNSYATPHTLGADRAAAVAGAVTIYKQQACLVIDIGSCITFDFVDAVGTYMGGAISPGISMRLNAMHAFTQALPQLTSEPIEEFVGNTTAACMHSGAVFGAANEIDATIQRYQQRFGAVTPIICGGDAVLLEKHIKSSIFAQPHLVLCGLNQILNLHVQTRH